MIEMMQSSSRVQCPVGEGLANQSSRIC
eukprot:COSAG02_NODE_41848_length_390_cov_0.872852_1_plen_27_part_01